MAYYISMGLLIKNIFIFLKELIILRSMFTEWTTNEKVSMST